MFEFSWFEMNDSTSVKFRLRNFALGFKLTNPAYLHTIRWGDIFERVSVHCGLLAFFSVKLALEAISFIKEASFFLPNFLFQYHRSDKKTRIKLLFNDYVLHTNCFDQIHAQIFVGAKKRI